MSSSLHRLAFPQTRSEARGQVLVIVALALVALVAMVGLVIDGGYAWGRQRITQNGADSVAKAGATVILRWLDGEAMTLGDIGCAVEDAAEDHGVDLGAVEVTDHAGTPIGVAVPECEEGGGGSMPAAAQGVQANTGTQFDTFLMGVVGIRQLTATANATAVVGPVQGTGVALPVTFPQTLTVCDDQEVTYTIEDWGDIGGADTWEPYEILPDPAVVPEGAPDADNLAIIPLCTTGPGSVGWLEFNCGNLEETISNPCDTYFPIPTWIQTQTGNVNNLEDELAEYHGDEPGVYEAEGLDPDGDADHKVQLPIHTNTCEEDAGVSDTDGDGINELNDCPEGVWTGGEGNNLWYGVPFWVGFVLDEAHVQGGDNECEQPEGTPQLVNPGGQVGCLKGWFVRRVAPPTDVGIGDINPGDDTDIAVVLIN